VTARIRQLEASLGVVLFDREGRGLRLTAAGDALLGYADRLLELASEARAAVRDDVVGGRLRLGAMESVAASRLPHPLAAFHRDHPLGSVELQTAPSRELVARVQARTLDAAIVGDEVDDERFARVPLYTEELVLVGPGGRPLGREPSRLSGCTLLVFHGNGCTYRRRMEQWLQSRRAVPGRVLEFASYHAILASAAAGVGISLVPRSVLEIYPQRAALSVARMPSQLARVRTALVMQRGRHVPALTQLANCLREDARRAARGK
jgi:DNA-binding transcriptional LysR family regulator